MATETYASPRKRRAMTRRQAGLLAGVVALVALVVVAVEVAWPLSAGLPIGWGQYNNSQFHLHVGAPPFWSVVADSDAFPRNPGCGLIVALAPPSQAELHSTFDLEKAPLTIQVAVAAPCLDGVSSGGQTPGTQPTGQSVVVAGQPVPVETASIGAGPISYSVVVTAHGFTYSFILNALSAAQRQQAQNDLPDFLTFVRSFRYIS